MSGSRDEAERNADLLGELGEVTVERFFGGWGLRHEGRQFGFVMDTLYLVTDEPLRKVLQDRGSHPFSFARSGDQVSTKYWSVPADARDDPDALVAFARASLPHAPTRRTRR
jgi:TfoX/Sxy family transcriptional regulator of competence genes